TYHLLLEAPHRAAPVEVPPYLGQLTPGERRGHRRRGPLGVARRSRLRGDKAVADPRLGDQVAGMRGIRLKLAAKLGEVDAQVVRLGLVVRAPHLLEQLALGNQLAFAAN